MPRGRQEAQEFGLANATLSGHSATVGGGVANTGLLTISGGKARCGVDLNRPFVQRFMMSPELTANEPGR